jgi:DNA-binding MarR family transcriptional regulator
MAVSKKLSAKKTLHLEVANRLHSAAIHLLRHARKRDVLAKQGPARLSALSVLVFGGPMALGQLAAAEQVKPPTMSRIVTALQRSGLAGIETDAADGRRILVSATTEGKLLLQEARDRRVELVADMLGKLTAAELDLLLKAAELMERALEQARSQ